MKKGLKNLFSLLLTASLSLGVTAQPPAKKLTGENASMASTREMARNVTIQSKGHPYAEDFRKVRTQRAGTNYVLNNMRTPAGTPAAGIRHTRSAEETSIPEIWGSLIFSDTWADLETKPVGLYTVPTDNSQLFTLLVDKAGANNGGVLLDNIYHTCEVESLFGYVFAAYFIGYDVNTGEVAYQADSSFYTLSMTLDPLTDTIYGVGTVNGAMSLVTLKLGSSKPEYQVVGTIDIDSMQSINSIAIDNHGKLFAIITDYESDGSTTTAIGSTLYSVDKYSGALTKIGDTGEIPAFKTDSSFDPVSGRMFWTLCPPDETGWLCEVDTSTGKATRIYQFQGNEEVVGLVIPYPETEAKAPASPSDVELAFEDDSLTGKVLFKTPTTFFDGTPAEGSASYSITANGYEVASGTAGYGEEIGADVALTDPGLYVFSVSLSNESGTGQQTKTGTVYIGKDRPESTTATLSYAEGMMRLEWQPVATSVNGGYINKDALTYTVTRYPDEAVVITGTKDTSFTETIAEPEQLTGFYYTVVAECEGLVSAAAVSNAVSLGPIIPPYTSDFSESGFSGFTVIDSNEDGIIWTAADGIVSIGYNTSMAMDDWLISPPMKLEAGKAYLLKADVYSQKTSYTERIEVMWGAGATAEEMTELIIDPTNVNAAAYSPLTISGMIMPETDGIYYAGFHGITDPDHYILSIKNIRIEAPISAMTPATAGNLNIKPDDSGAIQTVISFTAPSESISGAELSSLSKIEVFRNDELAKTIENPTPGTEISFTDLPEKAGDYTYTVVCFNEEGSSDPVSASAYIGVDYPAGITDISIQETENPGEVTISWNAIKETSSGAPLNPDLVTYQVYEMAGNDRIPVSEKISGSSFTLQAVDPEEQAFAQYVVFPYTDRGEGSGNYTPTIPVGKPYNGYSLTSADDLDTYILGYVRSNYASLNAATDSSFSDMTSADADDFFIYVKGLYLKEYVRMYTGKISLEGMANPGLTFHTYNIAEDDTNEIIVEVREAGDPNYTEILYTQACETGPQGWNKVMVDLSGYAGKTIQISITTNIESYTIAPYDAIKVCSILDRDIAVKSIQAPEKAVAGSGYDVEVTVFNDGRKEISGYTVNLYSDNKVVDSQTGENLSPGAMATFSFERAFSAIDTDDVTYFAEVAYAEDENESNNKSETVTVRPVASNLPAPCGLEGKCVDNAINLNWTAPEISALPTEAVTESFEDGDSFGESFGDWIFVDVDQSAIGGFQGTDIPGITPGVTTGSFRVWDTNAVFADNPTFASHSGDKYLFALFRMDGGQNDDWAISPLLDGNAQTVSFWAKSYSVQYPEAIEVYTSDGSVDPADFTLVEGSAVASVPGEWTEYKVAIPEGCRRFAIRSCASDSFMLMLDDVTFTPADMFANLDLVGYNMYRDGEKINDAPIAKTEYADSNCLKGVNYTYVVTAVYTDGESAASNTVEVTFGSDGVGSLYSGVKIASEAHNIVITGARGLNTAVYSTNGRTVFSGQAEEKTVIAVTPGVYAVKAGKTVVKIVVK